ncbi:MAG: choice-of-anchor B family protein [Bacteroidota bacterium]
MLSNKQRFGSLFLFIIVCCVCWVSSFSQNISFRSNIQYPRILSNIWGYTDTLTHKEYALVGVETGLSIVDVTNPDVPIVLFFVPNDTSTWQEPKVWSHYAYMTNEQGGGLLIVDLGGLPLTMNYVKWSGIPNENYTRSHTCFIDENGILYLNGSNIFNRGSILCDLKPDPMNPVFLGKYDDFYVHDCFARNDTLYTSEILNGQFSVVDVHDKANPQVIARQPTPFLFSHNVWLSDDGRFLFNTDERHFAPVTAYDISDLQDIKEIEQYRHSDFDSSIPHNTYYRGGFLYTSYYRDGVTIADAHKPDNIVEVGSYDTSPYPSGNGFEGCWGVYCFFPSGNIVCSDRQEGLFVLSPALKRACYLEGNVTDLQNGNPLPSITIEIVGESRYKVTDVLGNYKTGVADSGRYDVRFTDFGTYCFTRIISGVTLSPGNVTVLNAALSCVLPMGIEDLKMDFDFTVLPNLFTNTTLIRFHTSRESNSVISIFDGQGRKLKEFLIETTNAEIVLGEELSAGIYFLKAEQEGSTETIQLIKTD